VAQWVGLQEWADRECGQVYCMMGQWVGLQEWTDRGCGCMMGQWVGLQDELTEDVGGAARVS